MEIKDYSKHFAKSESKGNHATFFPKNIFDIIAGSTGCGKTNLLLNFLLEDGCLNYGSVFIYCSTLHQEAYQFLKKKYTEMENDIKMKCKINVKIAHFYEGDDEENLKDPKELSPEMGHIMVFDDVMLNNQTKIKEYFCKGRHNNVNVFYLVQSLHKISKHCIRDNANVFILFHQDDKTLKYFHETHISGDMDFKEFKSFCHGAWSQKHGFVVINVWEEPHLGRYISKYDEIYTPQKYIQLHKNT